MTPGPRRQVPWRAVAAVLGAGACWAGIETLGQSLSPRLSPFQVVWTRYGVHLSILFLVPRLRRRALHTTRPASQLFASLCMLGMPTAFIVAARRMPVAEIWSVFWVAPLLAALLGTLLSGEAGSAGIWLSAALGFAGAVLAFGHKWSPDPRLALLPLLMAACFAGYLVCMRRLRGESAPSKLFYTAAGVWLALAPFQPVLWTWPTPADAARMTAIGAIGLLGLYGLDCALEQAPLAALAPFLYGEAPFVLLFEALALGSQPGKRELLGAAIVCIALLAAGWMLVSRRPRAAE